MICKFNERKITWKRITQDIKIFIKNCYICQCNNKTTIKNPFIKQILFNNPRERYLVDLTETPDLIKNNTNFKYMIHVIDHYSKYLFGNLLKAKKLIQFYKS